MKTLFTLMILLFTIGMNAHAQEIDCNDYQVKVDSAQNALNSDQMELTKAQKNLTECQNIQQVVATPEYVQAKEATVLNDAKTVNINN